MNYVKWGAAVALLVAAFFAGHHVAALAGRVKLDAVTQANAKAAQHVAELATKASEAARAAEHKQADAFAAIDNQYQQDKAHAQASADRTIADLRAGNLRLRDRWTTQTLATQVAASASKPDAAANGCAGVAVDLFRAVDPIVQRQDAQIRGLQAILTAERKP